MSNAVLIDLDPWPLGIYGAPRSTLSDTVTVRERWSSIPSISLSLPLLQEVVGMPPRRGGACRLACRIAISKAELFASIVVFATPA